MAKLKKQDVDKTQVMAQIKDKDTDKTKKNIDSPRTKIQILKRKKKKTGNKYLAQKVFLIRTTLHLNNG